MTSRTITLPSLQISFRSLAFPLFTPYASNVLIYSYLWLAVFLLIFFHHVDFGILNLPVALCAIAAGMLLNTKFLSKQDEWVQSLDDPHVNDSPLEQLLRFSLAYLYRVKPVAQLLSIFIVASLVAGFWAHGQDPKLTAMVSPLLIAALFITGTSYGRARRHISITDALADQEAQARHRGYGILYLIYSFCAGYACYWWFLYATQHVHPSFIFPGCVLLVLGWVGHRMSKEEKVKDENTQTDQGEPWFLLSTGYGLLASILVPVCFSAFLMLGKFPSPSLHIQNIIAIVLLAVVPLLNCLSLQGFWPTEVNEEPDLAEIIGPRVQEALKARNVKNSKTWEGLTASLFAWYENLITEGIVTNGCAAAFSLESKKVNINPLVKHLVIRRTPVELTLPDTLMLCVTGALVGCLCFGHFVLALGLPDGQATIIQDFLKLLSMLSYHLSIIMGGVAGIGLALWRSRMVENVRNKICIMALLAVTPQIPDWLYQIGHAISH